MVDARYTPMPPNQNGYFRQKCMNMVVLLIDGTPITFNVGCVLADFAQVMLCEEFQWQKCSFYSTDWAYLFVQASWITNPVLSRWQDAKFRMPAFFICRSNCLPSSVCRNPFPTPSSWSICVPRIFHHQFHRFFINHRRNEGISICFS